MFKIRYTALAKKLNDGDLIEVNGIIEGLTTRIIRNKLHIGGVVRDVKGEII